MPLIRGIVLRSMLGRCCAEVQCLWVVRLDLPGGILAALIGPLVTPFVVMQVLDFGAILGIAANRTCLRIGTVRAERYRHQGRSDERGRGGECQWNRHLSHSDLSFRVSGHEYRRFG